LRPSCHDQVDDVYFDRPYYLAPATPSDADAFATMRDGAKTKVAAVARAVLFRRVRSVLIRAHGAGLIAHTLNFDYEVRRDEEAFGELPNSRADHEMIDLALHIIKKKAGRFDPKKFDDRYDAALLELVKAKMQGRKIEAPKAPELTKPADLIEALRQSAEVSGAHTAKRRRSARKTAAAKPRTTKREKAA
jgi:DNA end-binding protein Ku